MDGIPSWPSTISDSSGSDRIPLEPDLSTIPPITTLPAHFNGDEEHRLQTVLRLCSAPLTDNLTKTKVFIGKVNTKRRAEFELRSRRFNVEEVNERKRLPSPKEEDGTPSKKRRVDSVSSHPATTEGSSEETIGEDETEDESIVKPDRKPDSKSTLAKGETNSLAKSIFSNPKDEDFIWLIKTDWLYACISAKRLLPLGDYLVYKGRILGRPPTTKPAAKDTFVRPQPKVIPASEKIVAARPDAGRSILERAKLDAMGSTSQSKQPYRSGGQGSNRFSGRAFASDSQKPSLSKTPVAHLLQQTTSEYEGEDSDLPEPPEWVKKGIKYACQRFTPANPPNNDFIEELKKIRKARILIDDEVGVRAYSTSIAAIAAYPYKFVNAREILQIPGCDVKIANLWIEWKNTGRLQAVEDFENDEAMKVINLFYDIWGVGPKTARQFYYQNHWTELDDIIEYGWNDLDRVQQIGLKYYDEFLDPIPRAEVEHIADVVRKHAVRVRDERVTVTIVGGHRRGKAASGDVDMIVSHPELHATADLVKDLVESLDEEGWITHTLLLSTNSTQRGQATLPFRGAKPASGSGFDTLDKALVVWQEISWPSYETDIAADPAAKNPNAHRRVDIIISPWRTVGCAIEGWTSGTTFNRDLRRYCKNVKGWKFDSSGVRSRVTGEVIELEGPEGVKGTPEDAERKVFEGLGLEYIPPEMRVTG